MGLARPFWPHVLGLLTLQLLAPPLALVGPLPLKIAVDCGLGNRPLPAMLRPLAGRGTPVDALWLAAGLTVAVALLAQAQALASGLLHTLAAERLTLHFRSLLFRHAQRLSLLHHDRLGTSDSIFRIQYDTPSIQWVAVDGVIPLISAAAKVVGMGYVAARIDGPLALVAMAVAPPMFLLTRSFRRRLQLTYKDIKGREGRAFDVVQEVLTAIRVVKAFGREDDEQRRFVLRSGEGLEAKMRAALAEGLLGLLINLIAATGAAAVLLLGATRVRSGSMTLGDLLLVLAYLAQIHAPLQAASRTLASLQGSLASARRAFAMLDLSAEAPERPGALPLPRAAGAVEFRDVAFSYDGARPALEGVSFSVAPGTRVGIVGRTGAGKTTLVGLAMRLFDPDAGRVLLDGVDLRDVRVADLRAQFAVVLQEPVLFSTSIAENIAYARPDASRDEVVRAAEAAGAHEFVARLPLGYDTPVGERGMSLSGGERQRISLARAFLKDAPVLILDEPTSSVDDRTEAVIMDAMERLMAGRTSFMIAHRLGTLDRCDVLLRVEGGGVVTARGRGPAGDPDPADAGAEAGPALGPVAGGVR